MGERVVIIIYVKKNVNMQYIYDRIITGGMNDEKAKGRASVTMADYKCGDESVNPVSTSDINGTESEYHPRRGCSRV